MDIEARYASAFDLTPLPLLLVNDSGLIRMISSEAEELFEYPTGALIDQPVEILVPEEQRRGHAELRDAFRKFPAKRPMGQGRHLVGVTRTGRMVPLEISLTAVRDGAETWALVTAIDITARKAIEGLMQITLDASASAALMVARGGDIVFVNKSALSMFGYSREELVGQQIEMLTPLDVRHRHQVFRTSFFSESAARAMGAGQSLYALRKDGSEFRAEVALTPLSAPEGPMTLATVVDISDRLAAERAHAERAAAEAHAERLAMMNDELQRFAFAASHDLKAPLSTIRGIVYLCLDDLANGDPAEVERNLRKVLTLAQRGAGKVEKLLRLSNSTAQTLSKTSIDLEALIKDCWSEQTLQAQDAIELRLELGHAAQVQSSEEALDAILSNLFSNAVKFRSDTADPSWVAVRTKSDRDGLTIDVADNGVGVSAEDCEIIFQLFTRMTDRPGDGLGLAMVRRYAALLGGQIRAAPRAEGGAQFTLHLPSEGY